MKGNFVKQPGGSLLPADEQTWIATNKLKNGVVHKATVTIDQNYALHQKIFGFFQWCTKHYYGDEEAAKDSYNLDHVRRRLTIAAGYHRQVFNRDGETFVIVAESLKYEKMTPEVRQEFYGRIVNAAAKRVFDRTTGKQILDQLYNWFPK